MAQLAGDCDYRAEASKKPLPLSATRNGNAHLMPRRSADFKATSHHSLKSTRPKKRRSSTRSDLKPGRAPRGKVVLLPVKPRPKRSSRVMSEVAELSVAETVSVVIVQQ